MKRKRTPYIYTGACAALLLLCNACSCDNAGEEKVNEVVANEEVRSKSPDYRMPDNMDTLRDKLPARMPEIFNDSNYVHLAHAEYMGIKPIDNISDVFSSSRPVVKITDTKSYKLDPLTHSVPFLVPEAAQLLGDIGTAFRDTLQRRKLPLARLRVSSLLRTKASVQKLRKVNRNATEKSAHQYGTTFDIAYSTFIIDKNGDTVSDVRYRVALAEAIYDLCAANRCMVKYERKSPCFHITVIQ